MTWSVRLTKPPNDIVTTTISSLTQEQVGQIDDLWEGILQETQQPDADWNWNYKLRLAVNDDRYEVYGIELEALLQGVILLETQWHRSWLPQRFPLVYVEYLASAP